MAKTPSLYFDPAANRILATTVEDDTLQAITKDDVPDLIRGGAIVDRSAQELNAIWRAQRKA